MISGPPINNPSFFWKCCATQLLREDLQKPIVHGLPLQHYSLFYATQMPRDDLRKRMVHGLPSPNHALF